MSGEKGDEALADELQTAIVGIARMTEQLEHLHAVRRKHERVYGWRRSRAMFADLDRALRALRKAAR